MRARAPADPSCFSRLLSRPAPVHPWGHPGTDVASRELPCPGSLLPRVVGLHTQQDVGNNLPQTLTFYTYMPRATTQPAKRPFALERRGLLPPCPYKPFRLLMPPRCLWSGHSGCCQRLGGCRARCLSATGNGAVARPSSRACRALPEQQPLALPVPEHSRGRHSRDVGGHQDGDGAP